MFCAECGKQIPDGSKFCEYCGCDMTAHIKTGRGAKKPAKAAKPAKQPKDAGAKKSGKLIWLIVALAAVLLIAAAAFVLFVTPGFLKKDAADDTAVSEPEYVRTSMDAYRDGVLSDSSSYVYDENGNMILDRYSWNDNGTAYGVLFCVYDAEGNEIVRHNCFNDGDYIDPDCEIIYDEAGNIAVVNVYDIYGAIHGELSLTYDEEGRLVSYIDSCDDMTSVYVYVHGENGLEKSQKEVVHSDGYYYRYFYNYVDGQVSMETYYEYDELVSRTTYDSHGNPILIEQVDWEGNCVTSSYGYEYDEAGNCIAVYEYGAEDVPEYITLYTYDEAGNELTATFFYGDVQQYVIVNEYDDNNKIVSTKHYDADGNQTHMYEYKYVYDEAGNMVERTTYLDGAESYRVVSRFDILQALIDSDSIAHPGMYDGPGN